MQDDGWQEDFMPPPASNNYQEPRKYNDRNAQDSSSGPTEEVVLRIAGSSVGRIIGPRGATIKDLQATYNVKMDVARNENEDNTKNCTISGSGYNVQQAVEAINNKLEHAQQKYGNGERFEKRPPRQQNGSDYGNSSGRSDYGKKDFNFNSGQPAEPVNDGPIDWEKANRDCVSGKNFV